MNRDIVWFKEVSKSDIGLVGGKGANLGEMQRAKAPVPNGYIVTAQAYFDFLESSGLKKQIKAILDEADLSNVEIIQQVSLQIKKLIIQAQMPDDLAHQIRSFYGKLSGLRDKYVAIRSSATAEDLPEASFAGQQATYLNIKGADEVVAHVKKCWASLFETRAIFYRREQKFDQLKVGIAVPVQIMVESEVSGVMFTVDPVLGDKTKIIIEAVWGLGEMIVQGQATPDHYEVSKSDYKILDKVISTQKNQLSKHGSVTSKIPVSSQKQSAQKIPDKVIVEIAKIGKGLENHYFFPQDIEWAYAKGKVFITQTRPITTINQKPEKSSAATSNDIHSTKLALILEGAPASPGIAYGPVKIISSPKEINKILPGDVLVTSMTNPDFVPGMKKAVAVITDKGGRTSHAAIVSRELGIPAVVGTEKATKLLKTGQVVTVDGSSGVVYKGAPHITHINVNPKVSKKPEDLVTATKVYVNLAEPELASQVAVKNCDGVGLLRAEFMMSGIGVHPKKAIHDKKSVEYTNNLADGMFSFAKAFYPRPVIYRASDFKTNEYRNLIGGDAFEPQESNPMLGYRGSFRYISDPAVFNLELDAIKKIRKFGLNNLHLMVPFVRNVPELVQVRRIVSKSGLFRDSDFKFYMMAEIPSNVIMLEEFIKVGIDGISIGSNDLTMLILGTDRDNETVAKDYSELDPAVLWALEKLIKTANKHKITAGICGQAPSFYPELTKMLVEWGVSSVSVTPDVIDLTRQVVSDAEKSFINSKLKKKYGHN
ncbi:phosphoenolpyruvate synthase [Candidatus Curtissbacteria bacterium]|nr:phosphoenolpyruvate synthase [Candidatus Curtissbacteria bacterium]